MTVSRVHAERRAAKRSATWNWRRTATPSWIQVPFALVQKTPRLY
jgi:hypothetical protein